MIYQTGSVDPFSCKVAVYWNLSRDMWSIKTAERVGDTPKDRVIAYADVQDFTLEDCTFFVNRGMHQAGLAGTGKRGTKRNVVAWVVGRLSRSELSGTARRVTFHWPDPRSTFFYVDTNHPATTACMAEFRTVKLPDGKLKGEVWVS